MQQHRRAASPRSSDDDDDQDGGFSGQYAAIRQERGTRLQALVDTADKLVDEPSAHISQWYVDALQSIMRRNAETLHGNSFNNNSFNYNLHHGNDSGRALSSLTSSGVGAVVGGERAGFFMPGPNLVAALPSILAAEWIDVGREISSEEGFEIVGRKCILYQQRQQAPLSEETDEDKKGNNKEAAAEEDIILFEHADNEASVIPDVIHLPPSPSSSSSLLSISSSIAEATTSTITTNSSSSSSSFLSRNNSNNHNRDTFNSTQTTSSSASSLQKQSSPQQHQQKKAVFPGGVEGSLLAVHAIPTLLTHSSNNTDMNESTSTHPPTYKALPNSRSPANHHHNDDNNHHSFNSRQNRIRAPLSFASQSPPSSSSPSSASPAVAVASKSSIHTSPTSPSSSPTTGPSSPPAGATSATSATSATAATATTATTSSTSSSSSPPTFAMIGAHISKLHGQAVGTGGVIETNSDPLRRGGVAGGSSGGVGRDLLGLHDDSVGYMGYTSVGGNISSSSSSFIASGQVFEHQHNASAPAATSNSGYHLTRNISPSKRHTTTGAAIAVTGIMPSKKVVVGVGSGAVSASLKKGLTTTHSHMWQKNDHLASGASFEVVATGLSKSIPPPQKQSK